MSGVVLDQKWARKTEVTGVSDFELWSVFTKHMAAGWLVGFTHDIVRRNFNVMCVCACKEDALRVITRRQPARLVMGMANRS